MVHELVPRIEYKVYLNHPVNYFDIIPQLEQTFHIRFKLGKEHDKSQYILCLYDENLTMYPNWIELCKYKLVDMNYYLYSGMDDDHFTDATRQEIKHGYQDRRGRWFPINKSTTWYDIYQADPLGLRRTVKLNDRDVNILELNEIETCKSLPTLRIKNLISARDHSVNQEKSGWYYNLKFH